MTFSRAASAWRLLSLLTVLGAVCVHAAHSLVEDLSRWLYRSGPDAHVKPQSQALMSMVSRRSHLATAKTTLKPGRKQ